MLVGVHGWCARRPHGAVGWGYCLSDGTWASGGFVRGSAMVGELMAVLMLLKAHPSVDMEIQSSSSYLVGACDLWKNSWQRKGYIKDDESGERLANTQFIIPIHHLIDSSPARIQFTKVPDRGDTQRFPLHAQAAHKARYAAIKAQDKGVEVFFNSSQNNV